MGNNQEVRCTMCGWEGLKSECAMGHEDFYCPECGYESLEPAEGGESLVTE